MPLKGKSSTIAAQATASGEGAIGIIRLSGPQSHYILHRLFLTRGKNKLKSPQSHDLKISHPLGYRLYLGYLRNPQNDEILDQVMVAFFRRPASYTGEDMAEIYAHGGPLCLKRILDVVLASGARLAEGGEFTRRAYLNGKIDLSQAEAIADLVKAKNKVTANLAIRQLGGANSRWLKLLKNRLTKIITHLTAELEFPDDAAAATPEALLKTLKQITAGIKEVIRVSQNYSDLKAGAAVVIVGRANVGKSTLFNSLLGFDRAIAHHLPGTTRDYIEDSLFIGDLPVHLIDTAGWRTKGGELNELGWKKTRQAMRQAGLIVFVVDGSSGVRAQDQKLWQAVKKSSNPAIVVLNKSDKPGKINLAEAARNFSGAAYVMVSALRGDGLEKLKAIIKKILQPQDISNVGEAIFNSSRHLNCLRQALKYLSLASNNLRNERPRDMVTFDLRQAWESLGEITGQTATEELLNKIFSRFCLGK